MDEFDLLLRHHLPVIPWYLMVLAGMLLAVVTCRQHPKLSVMTFVVLCLALVRSVAGPFAYRSMYDKIEHLTRTEQQNWSGISPKALRTHS